MLVLDVDVIHHHLTDRVHIGAVSLSRTNISVYTLHLLNKWYNYYLVLSPHTEQVSTCIIEQWIQLPPGPNECNLVGWNHTTYEALQPVHTT